MLDFIGFVNDNTSLSEEKKTDLLSDFCRQYRYREEVENPEEPGEVIPNPVTRKKFANQRITDYIVDSVRAIRTGDARKALEIEELVLD